MCVALRRCTKACGGLEELHDQFSCRLLCQDDRRRVVAVEVANDALIGHNAYMLPWEGAGLAEEIKQRRLLKF